MALDISQLYPITLVSRQGWALKWVEMVELVYPGGGFSLTGLFQAVPTRKENGVPALSVTYLSSPPKDGKALGKALVQILTQLSEVEGISWDLEGKALKEVQRFTALRGRILGREFKSQGYLDPLDGWARWASTRQSQHGLIWEVRP